MRAEFGREVWDENTNFRVVNIKVDGMRQPRRKQTGRDRSESKDYCE